MAVRAQLDISINTGEGGARFLTDEAGFRVGATGGADADINVLALGDSFLAALQVDYEETFAARIEGGLAAEFGATVRVFNAGVGGWNPNEYLQRARQELALRSFDAVLVTL